MKRPGVGRRHRAPRRHDRAQSPAPRVIAEPARPYAEDLDLPFWVAHQRALSMFERFYLLTQLRRYEGSIKRTADHAGLSSKHVRWLIKRHGIDRRDFRPPPHRRGAKAARAATRQLELTVA